VPEKAVKKAFRSDKIFVSPDILREYREVPITLEANGKMDHTQLKALIAGIATVVSKATIVQALKKVSICRDPKDNMLLDCCLAADADFLITGDKDLLEITDIPFDLKIITPSGYTMKD
jgi:putative PIN family toxin of toxin-antitoxin system